ncbi:MAG TPA: mechanosensitive ion channel domain-containing protein [Streptosporangiaceae bacterium]
MPTLISSCGRDPGIACRLAWDITHNVGATAAVNVYLAGPVGRFLRIVFVILLALVARVVIHRLINRLTERAATSQALLSRETNERHEQRSRALGSILLSAVSAVIFGIATLTVLGDLGINLAPLLASAGVLGVALGFGAQNLVRDYLAGILMLVEDHYGVGDVVNVGGTTGTVEAMTLLTTRLRDVNGVVWHIHNGTIDRVGNEAQGWSRAVIDFPVPYDSDLVRIRLLMEQAIASVWNETRWRELMIEEPEVWGAQELTGNQVTMRIVAKTIPLRQWEVARELRARVKSALDTAGISWPAQEVIAITAPETSPATDAAGAS